MRFIASVALPWTQQGTKSLCFTSFTLHVFAGTVLDTDNWIDRHRRTAQVVSSSNVGLLCSTKCAYF